jgi:hypothetical protein
MAISVRKRVVTLEAVSRILEFGVHPKDSGIRLLKTYFHGGLRGNTTVDTGDQFRLLQLHKQESMAVSWTAVLALEIEKEVTLVGLGYRLDMKEERKESRMTSIPGFLTVQLSTTKPLKIFFPNTFENAFPHMHQV